MSIDTTKDEGFNMFMQALGFVWVQHHQLDYARHHWHHAKLNITALRTDDPEAIMAKYDYAMRAKVIKEHTATIRTTLLDLMGLQVLDVRNSEGEIIADDVVTVDRY